VNDLGFTSTTHYQFCHFTNVNEDYTKIMQNVQQEWERIDREFTIPYYVHVSIGWDNSPRFRESAVTRDNTPSNFADALRAARDFVDRHPDRAPLITVNSWNEWTETSYLQPDNVNGYGYLEAVKQVFVDGK
jgi:hypothetical protein